MEVAAEMSVPVGTVTSWLHRGRTQLASELDQMKRAGTNDPGDSDERSAGEAGR
jgi:hypothetical protein